MPLFSTKLQNLVLDNIYKEMWSRYGGLSPLPWGSGNCIVRCVVSKN